MSNPRFMVFKLKDLRIPIIILLVAIALFVFLLTRNKSAAQTFAPSDTYQDGQYIAGITLSDAEMDLIVEIKDSQITSISLKGLDEKTSMLYKDLDSGIDYVNSYVTATQSLELPQNASISPATSMLMDAVKVALSDDETMQITSTYEALDLPTAKLSTDQTDATVPDTTEATQDVDATIPDNAEAIQDVDASNTENSTANAADDHTSIMEEQVIEQ